MTDEVSLNVMKCLQSGKYSGDGNYCHTSEKKLTAMHQAYKVLLTNSGTAALELAALLIDASPGDEVILPSFTFTSSANCILTAGLKPVFCDIDPKTMNIDVNDAVSKVTSKTKAIMPVHYAGVACDMDPLLAYCHDKSIAILEDAAQGIGAKWKDRYLGTIGDLGAMSFHDTKNIHCGEGGALFSNNEKYDERAQIIREKGTNRSQFLRGQVDKYTWMEKGSSYVLAEPLAAMLEIQLDYVDQVNAKRADKYCRYFDELKPLEQKGILSLPVIPEYASSNYHIFHIILKDQPSRNSLMAHLRSQQIGATFHYIPLHSAPAGLALGYKPQDLPLTEMYAHRLLRLPLYPDLSFEQQDKILQEIYVWAKTL